MLYLAPGWHSLLMRLLTSFSACTAGPGVCADTDQLHTNKHLALSYL